MTRSILTAQQSRSARAKLGVSQSTVAKATGINRSQLALFEVQKYLLAGDQLEALREYYEEGGYRFGQGKALAVPPEASDEDSADEADASDFAARDSFLVGAGLDEEEVEARLQEIAANDEAIASLAQAKALTDFWSGEPVTQGRDEVLRRMARNYALVRALQGRDAPVSGQPGTVGALAATLIDPEANARPASKSFFDELFI